MRILTVDILKELKARMLDGSLAKFSMDNCSFDPTKRVLDFDAQSPSGYYKLDLADPAEREICKKLISECKSRKQDIFRNEKIDEKRINLPKHVVMGGYDGNWRGWEVRLTPVFDRCYIRIDGLSRRAFPDMTSALISAFASLNLELSSLWIILSPIQLIGSAAHGGDSGGGYFRDESSRPLHCHDTSKRLPSTDQSYGEHGE